MENLSPDQIEYWEDNKTDKPQKEGKDQAEKESAKEKAMQGEVRDEHGVDTHTEEQSPIQGKPKFNARYYSKFGEFLHDPPRWDYLDAMYGNGKSEEGTRHHPVACRSPESYQTGREATQELAYNHDRDQAAQKGQQSLAESKEKPMQWEDVVDDPGEWDMCQ